MTPNALVMRGPHWNRRPPLHMEDAPGEKDSPCYGFPFSQRELHSVYLQLVLASSETERKQILDSFGMTTDDFTEFFGIGPGLATPMTVAPTETGILDT